MSFLLDQKVPKNQGPAEICLSRFLNGRFNTTIIAGHNLIIFSAFSALKRTLTICENHNSHDGLSLSLILDATHKREFYSGSPAKIGKLKFADRKFTIRNNGVIITNRKYC